MKRSITDRSRKRKTKRGSREDLATIVRPPAENVLEWPSALSQQFRDTVEKLKFGDPITPPSLPRRFCRAYLSGAPKIVGASLGEDETGGDSRVGILGSYGTAAKGYRVATGAGGEETLNANGLPDELDDSYNLPSARPGVCREQLISARPSWIRVWVARKTVGFKNAADIMRNTNEAAGATRDSNAAVKQICSAAEVGRRAPRTAAHPAACIACLPPPLRLTQCLARGRRRGCWRDWSAMRGTSGYGETSGYGTEAAVVWIWVVWVVKEVAAMEVPRAP